MTKADRDKWDDRYGNEENWHGEFHPSKWLMAHAPKTGNGVALDIACGVGNNSVWLAGRGYKVVGIDGSRIGLRRAKKSAEQRAIKSILFVQADLDQFRLVPNSASLIAVIRFLNRDLYPSIKAALKPGGWLIMEIFNQDFRQIRPDINPAFLLNQGEWREAFAGLRVVAEEDREGVAYFAGRKPTP